MSSIREELRGLIALMVDRPEAVTITETEEGRRTVFQLRVAPEDLGKVIGRKGRTARALRALLEARGAMDRQLYGLEILDD